MSQTSLRVLRDLLPPLVARPLARRFLGVRYTGSYATWAEAQRASRGYDAPDILEQVLAAARVVRDGKAAYERDGVTFQEPAYRWPLLAALLAEAARHDGRLRVLDFGGSLASVYFQHRALLRGLKELRWAVVEQAAFVEAGRREFANEELTFHPTLAEAAAMGPHVILFSGVLGWIAEPHAMLAETIALEPPAIILDRTPMTGDARDVAKVQRVPASIYRASYPCWFLSRARVLAHFPGKYELAAELPQVEDAKVPGVVFGGLYFRKSAEPPAPAT